MTDVRVCFEINGLGEDENGDPRPCGLQITIGETEREIDCAELVKTIDMEKVADWLTGLGVRNIKPEDLMVITPEEYDAKYGGKEE